MNDLGPGLRELSIQTALGEAGAEPPPPREAFVEEELVMALAAIQGMRRRIRDAAPMTDEQSRRMAMALSVVDAALGDAVRELHESAPDSNDD